MLAFAQPEGGAASYVRGMRSNMVSAGFEPAVALEPALGHEGFSVFLPGPLPRPSYLSMTGHTDRVVVFLHVSVTSFRSKQLTDADLHAARALVLKALNEQR